MNVVSAFPPGARCLALDLGLMMGWRSGSRDGTEAFGGTFSLRDPKDDPEDLGLLFMSELWKIIGLIEQNRADLLLVEAVMPAKQERSNHVAVLQHGHHTVARMAATHCDIPIGAVGNSTWYSAILGTSHINRDERKAMSVAMAERDGVPVADDNAADAYCIWKYWSVGGRRKPPKRGLR